MAVAWEIVAGHRVCGHQAMNTKTARAILQVCMSAFPVASRAHKRFPSRHALGASKRGWPKSSIIEFGRISIAWLQPLRETVSAVPSSTIYWG